MSLDIILFSISLGLNLVMNLLAGSRAKNLYGYSMTAKDFSTGTVLLQLLGMEDKRVLYVKLADQTHNMRTI